MNNSPNIHREYPTAGIPTQNDQGISLKKALGYGLLAGSLAIGGGTAISGDKNSTPSSNKEKQTQTSQGTNTEEETISAKEQRLNAMANTNDSFSLYSLGNSQPVSTYTLPEIDRNNEGTLGQRLQGKLENELQGHTGEVIVRGIDPVFEITRGNIESPRGDFSTLIDKHYKNTQEQDARITFAPKYDSNTAQESSQPTAVVGQTTAPTKANATKTNNGDSSRIQHIYQPSQGTSSKVQGENRANEAQSGYMIDYNGDGYVDRLNPQGENTIITNGKTGESIKNSNLETRMHLIHTFDYDGKHQCDDNKCREFPSAYVLAKDNGGENIVEYFVATNGSADKTKFEKATTFGGFIDKVANAHVRGEFLENNFEQALKLGEVQFKYDENNIPEAAAYSGTFAQDVSAFDMAMRMGAGSAIYSTLKSDFLPSIEANSALVQNRGAGLNEIILSINEGGRENLSYTAQQGYNNQVQMYEAQIEASKQNIGDLNNL